MKKQAVLMKKRKKELLFLVKQSKVKCSLQQ